MALQRALQQLLPGLQHSTRMVNEAGRQGVIIYQAASTSDAHEQSQCRQQLRGQRAQQALPISRLTCSETQGPQELLPLLASSSSDTQPCRARQPQSAFGSMGHWAPQLHPQPCPLHNGMPIWSGQWRGYKSYKRSMKPVYVQASRRAAAPFLPDRAASARSTSIYQQAPIIDTALPAIPTVPKPPELRVVGRLTGEYMLDTQPVFGVVALAGKQFKVTTDDVVFVGHLAEVAVNEVVSLEQVLLVGTKHTTIIGRPYVAGARILAAVEEHFKDGKVHVFRFKKRNRYKKYSAPRPPLTTLRILHIQAPSDLLDSSQMPSMPILPIQLSSPVLLPPATPQLAQPVS